MSIAEKLTTVAENMPKVFEAGQQAEYNRFWNNYLGPSTFFAYRFAGEGWTDATFKPNQDIVVIGNASAMFRQSNIKDLISCLGVHILDLSLATNLSACFYGSMITSVAMKISETTPIISTMFQACSALTALSIDGTIATNGLDLHWSTLLDRESLLNIIDCLKDYSEAGGTWTVTLGAENLAKLTDAEKAVATQKGWSLV